MKKPNTDEPVAITMHEERDEGWRIQDIEQGVAEADRGEFATDSEVNAFFARYRA